MTVFHGLISWSLAGLSIEFILKWSFNWTHRNKIGDNYRHENNISCWENSWCHYSAAAASVSPLNNCSHLDENSRCTGQSCFHPLLVNLYVSCVILRQGSKTLTLHSGRHITDDKAFWKSFTFCGEGNKKTCGRKAKMSCQETGAENSVFKCNPAHYWLGQLIKAL